MRRHIGISLAAGVGLAVFSAGALEAQRPDTLRARPPGAGAGDHAPGTDARGRHPGARARAHAPDGAFVPGGFAAAGAPGMMMAHRQALGLTDAQVRRLETVAAAEREAMQRLAPEMLRAHADFLEAVRGDVDLDRAERAVNRMARLHAEMMMARVRAWHDARAALTPEQRARFDAMAGPMGMHPSMFPMMMPGTMMPAHPGARRGMPHRPGKAPHGAPGAPRP